VKALRLAITAWGKRRSGKSRSCLAKLLELKALEFDLLLTGFDQLEIAKLFGPESAR